MRRLRVVFFNKPARCVLLLLFAVFAMSMEAEARSAGGGRRVRAEALFKGFRFPDLAEGFLFSLTSGCYRGGGDGAWERSGSSSHRLGRSSLPSAFVLELRRPPNPPGIVERQPVSGLAVVSTGRKAACCIGVRASSMPIFLFRPGAKREAVVHLLLRVHRSCCCFLLEAMAEGWWSGRSKWRSPRRRWDCFCAEDALWTQLRFQISSQGPSCKFQGLVCNFPLF